MEIPTITDFAEAIGHKPKPFQQEILEQLQAHSTRKIVIGGRHHGRMHHLRMVEDLMRKAGSTILTPTEEVTIMNEFTKPPDFLAELPHPLSEPEKWIKLEIPSITHFAKICGKEVTPPQEQPTCMITGAHKPKLEQADIQPWYRPATTKTEAPR